MPRPGASSDQRIGFVDHLGRRIAYATVGAGPLLLCDLGRLHHLDVFWRHPPYRKLVEELARRFTVVRWDRPGCGLSQRGTADFTIAGELVLFDRLLAEVAASELAVVASGSSSPVMLAIAAARQERVSRLAVFGAWASTPPDSASYRGALDRLLRTRFDLALHVLAQATAAGCDAEAIRWLAGAYRQVASGPTIAQWLDETVRTDVREALGHIACPTLVLHRRDDPANRFELARDVAAGIRDAVLLPLEGRESLMWEGDVQALLVPLIRFLAGAAEPAVEAAPAASITEREREIAALVMQGLTNADIAQRLGIGRRTVESHLERLRSRLGLDTRAELAAWTSRHLGR